MRIAQAAKMVHPTPYPSALNMYGAKSGKPKPQSERAAAAPDIAEAAWRVKLRGEEWRWR